MPQIEYHHDRNRHSVQGAAQGLRCFLEEFHPKSILDVGAGTGTWLHAAQQLGVKDIMGVDGVSPDGRAMWVDPSLVRTHDLQQPFALGRTFDAVLCLEVAEHIPEAAAATLVRSLCLHGNLIFFSAACPGQRGEHHVNCQWPAYWQALFNHEGFVCRDDLRAKMWDIVEIEPWYRQNAFSAIREPSRAGHEPRIRSLIHPDMIPCMDFPDSPTEEYYASLERGELSPWRYLWLMETSLRQHVPDE
ncbi:MAG: class I SAM-dependent methyltransferase [Phenylobacterium sp.]|uniref:class I SAM-dependent methyltransferase n=1 Tax=Phenylobacterium sp. TaxID=1871053 RepID=UPI002734341E|nr:class I SAM-dependent methyltransferase [Phenylobacterium sp.]MDP3175512.1 class I SAM-dependent methyltransferase [Phenylobacterium sp.]